VIVNQDSIERTLKPEEMSIKPENYLNKALTDLEVYLDFLLLILSVIPVKVANYILSQKPSITTVINTERCYYAFICPTPQRIGVNVEEHRHFLYGHHII
jgi:hypothetical protein